MDKPSLELLALCADPQWAARTILDQALKLDALTETYTDLMHSRDALAERLKTAQEANAAYLLTGDER